MRRRPQVVAGARANRAFLARAVRYLAAECGIRQFLDIGTGLPASGRPIRSPRISPGTAASSTLTTTHWCWLYAQALLISCLQGSCDYIEADLRDPPVILARASRTLDLTQPAAVLLLAVLHFIPDTDDPGGIVAALARQVGPRQRSRPFPTRPPTSHPTQ